MTKIKCISNLVLSSFFMTSIFAHGDEFAQEAGNFHGGMGHMMSSPFLGFGMWVWIIIFIILIVSIILLMNKK